MMNDATYDAHGSRAGSSSSPASPSPSQYLPPKRTKVSCFPCRQRKSKCDHARPCSSCMLRGTAHQCSDPNGASGAAASAVAATSGTSSASSSTARLAARLPAAAGSSSDALTHSLTASASMPAGLSDYAAAAAARSPPTPSAAAEHANGPQHKRRRTEAASSRLEESHAIDAFAPGSQQTITEEMQRIKQSMARLETLLSHRPAESRAGVHAPSTAASTPTTSSHNYQVDPSQDAPGDTDPPSLQDRHRWQHLRSLLPPLIDTHRMMHYVLTEGDWLLTCVEAPRFVALWKYAFERQAISDVFAVRVLIVVALAGLLISDNPQRTIQFAVPIRSLHTTLAKEAVRMIEAMPAMRYGRTEAESCDLIDIMLSTSLYFRCLGKELIFSRFTERAVSCTIRAGFDKELDPSWIGLTHHQIERRRTILMEVIMSTKWLAFHCRKDLILSRVKSFCFGRPHLRRIGELPSLEAWPQSDHVARTIAALPLNGSGSAFAFRAKPERERDTVRNYIFVSCALTEEIPPIVELARKTETRLLQPEALARCTKEEMRDMARQTRQILARLEEWHRVILPQAGVGFDRALNARITLADPVEAKTMAVNLMLNSAVFYMTSILCRAWLLLADRLQSLTDARRDEQDEFENATTVSSTFLEHLKQRSIDHVQHVHASWLPPTFLTEVQAAVVENGRRCIRSIPVIRTLQSLSSSQFYVGWTSQAHMQAAVNLAIPLVRSHVRQHQRHQDRTEPGYADANLDALRRDVLTIFEAVSQLSNNHMAHRTAKVLNRALRLGGIERPLMPVDDNAYGVEDAWADEEQAASSSVGSGQMQNAAEGLALLSAASSARAASDSTASRRSANGGSDSNSPGVPMLAFDSAPRGLNSHSHLVPFEDSSASYATTAAAPAADGAAREPMWWEARTPNEMSHKPPFGTGPATGAGDSSAMGGPHAQQQQQQAQPQQHHMTDSQLLDELLNLDASFWQFVLDGAGDGESGTVPASTGAASVRT
ncbi:conserved hypothetical protein [Sporisorium reilianum SRZ2]|uniref:Zn(2)-C6 fungal-type domain-containing protein n=1 Tax=Sporisorium reilianum (strain SRZ2) TaxID=999809 RepID=E6ZQG3_SPORE|nr:conserved hypothetical protein [Sporisorium reilianum SRZ2]